MCVWKIPSSSLAPKRTDFHETEREQLEIWLLETHMKVPGSNTAAEEKATRDWHFPGRQQGCSHPQTTWSRAAKHVAEELPFKDSCSVLVG